MERSWKYRRACVFAVLGFCMGMIVCTFLQGDDSMVNRDIIAGAWLMMGAVIGSYVFGAIWDDKLKGSERLRMGELPPSSN